jgi:hypothetical protein
MPAPANGRVSRTRVSTPQHIYWRRRLALLAIVALVVIGTAVLVGSGDGDGEPQRAAADDAAVPPPPHELPRGGRSVLPEFRVVAFYGAPQSRELGALGIGSPRGAARRLARQAKPYGTKRHPVLPALELITVIANADPGEDGMYRSRQRDAVIRRYLRAARRAKALLLLDIQPGRSDFFTEATRLEKWLKEPDVGLALDPEWRVQEGEVPGQVIGRVGAREVNATSAWLAQLVAKHDLPEKLFVIHQFTDDMIPEQDIKPRDGLAFVLNVDGFGNPAVKKAKYREFVREAHDFDHGFKLFYEEDTDMMRPREVMRLRPKPVLVVYE